MLLVVVVAVMVMVLTIMSMTLQVVVMMVVILGNFVEAVALNDGYFARGSQKLTRMYVCTTAFYFRCCVVWCGVARVHISNRGPVNCVIVVLISERRSCSINRLLLRS